MTTHKEKSEQMREELADNLIKLIESEGLNWKRTWNPVAFLPTNGSSGNLYHGVNRMNLAMTAMMREYSDPRWVTAHQAFQKGWKIKKGEKAAIVEKWGMFTFEKQAKDNQDLDNNNKEVVMVPRLQRIYHVFNFDQLIGPEPYIDNSECKQGFELADELIAMSRCSVCEVASGRACYQPTLDRIVLPLRQVFDGPDQFVATLIHEMAHSTGHVSRLNRLGDINYFGSESYALEELRAEFSSVFIQASLGINLEAQHVENHAAYLQSWLGAIKKDKNVLFSAISDAEKISDYLLDDYQSYKGNTSASNVA